MSETQQSSNDEEYISVQNINVDAIDKRYLRGEDRTEAQLDADESPGRNTKRVPNWKLAWELNRLDSELDHVVTERDVIERACHGKTVYRKRFGDFTTAQLQANVRPPKEHIIDAIKEYVANGRSFATTGQLKEFMYPNYNPRDMSSDFGVKDTVLSHTDARDAVKKGRARREREIMDEWEYPKISTNRIAHTLRDLEQSADGYRGVNAELWSDASKKTYHFTMVDE